LPEHLHYLQTLAETHAINIRHCDHGFRLPPPPPRINCDF
jgi:hypothetical protein